MTGKLAIVAAAGPGMGMAIARRFAREGFDLALIARDAARTAAMAAEIGATGYAADLGDPAAIASCLDAIAAAQGTPEVLVYNGGAWNEDAPLAQPAEAFHRDLALCVTGAYACTRAVAPGMRARGGGTILLTGGGLALNPGYGARIASLTAGKAALRGLGFALHEGLKPEGIHLAMVTIAGTVAPGTAFDPDRIADSYWALHAESRDAWSAEVVFTGAA
jgi:NAD(P)-dependent dehydrogenase (short-subunit alcohol dehydrogenase family)